MERRLFRVTTMSRHPAEEALMRYQSVIVRSLAVPALLAVGSLAVGALAIGDVSPSLRPIPVTILAVNCPPPSANVVPGGVVLDSQDGHPSC